ncbi:MAG: glycosyltransferase [Puniceicoccaceae bacterium]|nr:MAG: glycosyltransferase [Puniceicoccaceae bacterium]
MPVTRFVTGAEGTGKTTLLPLLRKRLPGWAIHDFDEVGVPDAPTAEWRRTTTGHWLGVALDNQRKGISTCIVGLIYPSEAKAFPAHRELAPSYCILELDTAERAKRLRERNTPHHIDSPCVGELQQEFAMPDPALHRIDVTGFDPETAGEAVAAWANGTLTEAASRRQSWLFVTHEASLTGAPMFLLHFLRWLRANTDLDLRLYSVKDGPLLKAFGEVARVHPMGDEAGLVRLAASCDLVYINTICAANLGHRLAGPGIPLVTHVHELDVAYENFGPRWMALMLQQSRRLVCCSEFVAERMRMRYGVAAERLTVAAEMIDTRKLRVRREAREKPPPELAAFPQGTRFVMGCGSRDVRKGFDLFLQVAVALRGQWSAVDPVRFVWIGKEFSDAYATNMRLDIGKAGLAGDFICIAETDDPHRYLKRADVFCLTSREDPYPLAMLEAAALGKPIVAFAGAGGGEHFCGQGAGLVVPYLDVYGMAAACGVLLEDEERRQSLGRRAEELARERHAIDVVSRGLHRQLMGMMEGGLGRQPLESLETVVERWSREENPRGTQYRESIRRRRHLRSKVGELLQRGNTAAVQHAVVDVLNQVMDAGDADAIIETLVEASEVLQAVLPEQAGALLERAKGMATARLREVDFYRDTPAVEPGRTQRERKVEAVTKEIAPAMSATPGLEGKRVLVFSDDPGQGGVAQYVHGVLLGLRAAGVEAVCAQPEAENPLVEAQRAAGVRHVWTGFNPEEDFTRSFSDGEDAVRILDAVEPEVVLFADCCPLSHLAAKQAVIDRLIPWVATCNVDAPYLAKKFPEALPVAKRQYGCASEVIGVSRSVLETLRTTYGLETERGRVVYYGRPDLYFKTQDKAARMRLRKELALGADAVLCLTAARLAPDKGHLYQIEAVRRLREKGRLGNLHLAWAGDGPLREELQKAIEANGLGDRIHLLGHRWDLPDWLSAADVFVLSSRVEAMPLSIMEAMAMGLPVAATAVAGVPEELGETGALLPDPKIDPAETVRALADVLDKWGRNEKQRRTVGAAARERAERLFREERMQSETLAILTEATRERVAERAARKLNALVRDGEILPALARYRENLETAVEPEAGETLPVFAAEELASIRQVAAAWKENPGDTAAAAQLRELRNQMAVFLAGTEERLTPALFAGNFGEVYRELIRSGIQDEDLTAEEAEAAAQVAAGFDTEGNFSLARLMASLLFRRAWQEPALLAFELIPSWFGELYFEALLHAPALFDQPGDAERYRRRLAEVTREIHRRIQVEEPDGMAAEAALTFLRRANFMPLYFTEAPCAELHRLRAEIMAWRLGYDGFDLAGPPQAARARSAGGKIRLGILSAHFGPQTETYTVIPLFAELDRRRFEVVLIALQKTDTPLERFCRERADRFIVLDGRLPEQVNAVRAAALDALVIGTNVTAVTNDISLLALHRLAPVQICSNSSPVSTGMAQIDAYLSGTLSEAEAEEARGHYTEALCLPEGPAHCFAYGADARPAEISVSRAELGLPEDAVVFASAANCFKLLPELQETWARILAAVPGSRLLLHPFNPNWSNRYPVFHFARAVRAAMRRHGVEEDRLILSESRLPGREDVKALLAVADVYLDSYPFAGVNSTVDPLELGLPCVVREGRTFRSRMAGALLRDLGLEDLIVTEEDAYIEQAVRLGREPAFRGEVSARIRKAMAAGPRFFDTAGYAGRFAAVVEVLVRGRPEPGPERKETAPSQAIEVADEDLLARATAAYADGRYEETETLCRELVERSPETAPAWALLGRLARRFGDYNFAAELLEQALALDAAPEESWVALGEVRLAQAAWSEALEAFAAALDRDPGRSDAVHGRALALWRSGDTPSAETAFREGLASSCDRAEAARLRMSYAAFLHERGQVPEAIRQLRKAATAERESAEPWVLLGRWLRESGNPGDALASLNRGLKKFPEAGGLWLEAGKVLLLDGRAREAVDRLRRAAELMPDDGETYFNLGYALQQTGRRGEALEAYRKAEAGGWEAAELHLNLGVLLKDREEFMEAARSFGRALALKPDSVAAYNNLGAVCSQLGMISDAIDCFGKALELEPAMPGALNNLGQLLKNTGRAGEALPCYRRAVEADPGQLGAIQNQLLCTLYQTDLTPQAIFEAHRHWGAVVADAAPRWRRQARSPRSGRRLRIGYLSPDFCAHPVAAFAEALLAGHDRDHFEIHAYADVLRPDETTGRLCGCVEHWHEVAEWSDEQLAERIERDGIDLLIDLAGHTARNRLQVLAARPAPVTLTALGYPATTGVPGIDYRLTDAEADPEGEADARHTERLLRLPRTAWCWRPPGQSPLPAPAPCEKNGYITFGSFNNLAKMNAALLETWAEFLRTVPDSRLLLKARPLLDEGVRRRFESFFTARGIASERLRLVGPDAGVEAHLARYHEVDIALDTFPYHGTTTTCEALWMGVPVVTRAGEDHRSRVGVSLLKAVGRPEWIADDAATWVRRVAEMAGDSSALSAVRAGLREDLRRSPLLDVAGYVAAVEAAFGSILEPALSGVER